MTDIIWVLLDCTDHEPSEVAGVYSDPESAVKKTDSLPLGAGSSFELKAYKVGTDDAVLVVCKRREGGWKLQYTDHEWRKPVEVRRGVDAGVDYMLSLCGSSKVDEVTNG